QRPGARLVRRVHVGAFLDQSFKAFRARVERSQNERRVALRVAGIHVRAVVEQLADSLRGRISAPREQGGCDRPWLTLFAGVDRARRRRWEPGPTCGQKNRDSNAGEQNNRDSQARETLVTFPTTHDATPLRDWEMLGPHELRRGAERLSTARSGSTGRHLE